MLDTRWALLSLLAVTLALIIIYLRYDRRGASAKEVALIATLAALAALGRIPFAAIPSLQPTTFLVLITGYVFGVVPGFMVGSLAAFVSNFFLGHGPWTPWQMLGWGLVGVSGGILGGLQLKEANDFAVIQDVVNKNSDIGVVSFTNLNEGCWNNILKRGELVFHEISENKLHIIVGQKNPLYDSEEVNIEDLAHFPMIFLSHDYNKWTHEEANVLGLNDNPLMTQVSSRDLLIKTVAPTMGVAFGLRPFNSAVSEYYSYQQIKSIPCNIPNFYIKVGYIKQDTSTAVVNEFISLLEQSYS